MNKVIREFVGDSISQGKVSKDAVDKTVKKLAMGKYYEKVKKTKKLLNALKALW